MRINEGSKIKSTLVGNYRISTYIMLILGINK